MRKQMSPDFSLHVITGIYDTMLVKSSGRTIGHIDSENINKFILGDYAVFRPVHNWKTTFSMGLKKELLLVKEL